MVVDDCSTQDIYPIVEQFADKLSIRYIRNDTNVGCGMTRQRGIDETEADYITFVDSDDILTPKAVDVYLSEIERSCPDVIASTFLLKTDDNVKVRMCNFEMCHGKVYKVAHLRKYDIREAPEVTCADDYYLNYQVFSLTDKVSFLDAITSVQIDTPTSVTHEPGFFARGIKESGMVKCMSEKQVSRYLTGPNPYRTYKRDYYTLMFINRDRHQTEIDSMKDWLDYIVREV
jgi:glycosyltransferase involved in cell wall biosynthesis